MERALSIFIGFSAFWRVGTVVALFGLFFELPVAALSVNRALRVFANCWPTTGPCVFWIHSPWACVCCFVPVACWQWGNRLLPVGVCVQKMNNESSKSVSVQPVKFSGKYAGISTDCFAFLTTLCGITPEVATKVAIDAASSVGRAMSGVNSEVSFGRMSKDTLATIKETATRKGVSVNEFPLQIAYLAEKTRKFCFDNRIKVSNVELPEPLQHYLLDTLKGLLDSKKTENAEMTNQ